ncbi:hypothetical protein [Pseudoruegeria aquimaris]|nr:hypothetical protein [Pseudoruegeria aquimaris]
MPRDTLISAEQLAGIHPENWAMAAEANRDWLGSSAEILITLREPDAWLRSRYQQDCHHAGCMIPPQVYFGRHCGHRAQDGTPRLDMAAFSHRRLIDIYTGLFDRVFIVKYEALAGMAFLEPLFGLSPEARERIGVTARAGRSNRSYSDGAVRLTSGVRRLLGRGAYTPERPFRPGLRHRYWRKLMQGGFDHVVRYRRFRIDWAEIEAADMQMLKAEYAAIPEVAEFRAGQLSAVISPSPRR